MSEDTVVKSGTVIVFCMFDAYKCWCKINRSHSIIWIKAGFKPLQIFTGHWLGLRPNVSISERTTYLDNFNFSAFSVLWWTVKQLKASYVIWEVGSIICDKIVHTKMHFSVSP